MGTEQDIDIQPRPKHTSYSAVSSFTSCGEKYRLNKVVHAPEQGAWWSSGGTAVHAVTEAFDLADLIDDTEGFEDDIPSMFEHALEQALEERPTADLPFRASKGQDKDWWLENGPLMVYRYIKWRREVGWQLLTTEQGVPAVELKVQGEYGGLPILAYIDRVFVDPEGRTIVTDIKTGSRAPSDLSQLGWYKVLLEDTLGIKIDAGCYWMARKGEHTVPTPLDLYTPDYLARIVAPFKTARETGAYVANPASTLCGVCGFAYACFAKGGFAAHEFAPNAT